MDEIAVLDFGGQYTHLIANRIRRLGVYASIFPGETQVSRLTGMKGLILSGGPASVYAPQSPQPDADLFTSKIPILGLCYGLQLLAKYFGGKVEKGHVKEYGLAKLTIEKSPLFADLSEKEDVWMSHGDSVVSPPQGFKIIGSTPECPVAAMGDDQRRLYGLQFHPEVTHTPHGMRILENFITICGCRRDWSMKGFLAKKIDELSNIKGNIFLLVSGGVDSAVCFALLGKALGNERVKGLHIDTGLMRQDESKEVVEAMGKLGLELEFVDASDRFLTALTGIVEPEEKRRIIGEMFVRVAQETMGSLGGEDWRLAQGTIYPDTIETKGSVHAALIKTHHNRVPMMQKLIDEGKVVEPIRDLYKDEVRELGLALGLPPSVIMRHPFPGPGLAVRCLCNDRSILRFSHPDDTTFDQMVAPLNGVIAPVQSVGVQGDERTYRHPGIVWGEADWKLLDTLSSIPNRLPSINRMLYLLTEGPPDVSLHRAFITRQRIHLLQKADRLVVQATGDDETIWQFPVVLAPLGKREAIILRPVTSQEAMTAGYARLPLVLMRKLAKDLTELGVGQVFYDFTTKPPATIEWE